jgi:hypothetical protein
MSALKDGLAEVLEAARETDPLDLASPVCYWHVSALVDRTFSYLVSDSSPILKSGA